MSVPKGQQFSSVITPELDDCGKRASDLINTYITHVPMEELRTKFIAIRLSDGGSDGRLYDSKKEAVRFQIHEQQCMYVSFRNLNPGGVNARELAIVIKFHRAAYAAGARMVDPDDQFGGPDFAISAARWDWTKSRTRLLR